MSKENPIAIINDAFRKGLLTPVRQRIPGQYVVTSTIHNLPIETKGALFEAIRNFTDFKEENDPYGEHEFGVVELLNLPKVFWRIDYFSDETMEFGADDPAGQCYRKMTVMFADEY